MSRRNRNKRTVKRDRESQIKERDSRSLRYFKWVTVLGRAVTAIVKLIEAVSDLNKP